MHIIRKRQLKLVGQIMKKEGLENLALMGHIKDKRDREKEQATYLTRLDAGTRGRGVALVRGKRWGIFPINIRGYFPINIGGGGSINIRCIFPIKILYE